MLRGRQKYLISQYFYEIFYWITVMLIFILVRFSGSTALLKEMKIFYDPVHFNDLLLITLFGSFLLGVILATIRQFVQKKLCKNLAVGKVILVGTLMQLTIFLIFMAIYMLAEFISLGYSVDDFNSFFYHEYHLSSVALIIMFFIAASLQYSLLIEADKKMGINVLGRLLLGKYHRPKQENRIFMFLDMKDSTKTAEQLGHLTYSRLLQEIFSLLTDLVIDFKAEIYQFVGDEVVLTWKSEEGHKNSNTLRFFFAFQTILKRNGLYFKNKYNVNPVFKAGIHEGEVSVAEVGEINTKIAYHGDVLNTTSRIQELCNYYNSLLLVSDKFMGAVDLPSAKFKETSSEIKLRGRMQPITIFALDTNN